MNTPTLAVHCRPTGADTRPLPGGGLSTHVLYAPPVPVRGLSAARILLPGARSLPPQAHRSAETALILLSGYPAILSGERMNPIQPSPGDVVYIPTATAYAVINLSLNAAVLALSITTDPHYDSDTVAAPRFNDLVADRAAALRTQHHDRIKARRASGPRRRRR